MIEYKENIIKDSWPHFSLHLESAQYAKWVIFVSFPVTFT